ncbi:hypothetical protein EYF80_058769 [Liparis tanakae]|uniref:Uncharacterized protein n=1 Tax=Liparis tanakae TaxID=230148 RepID=A0A4Z2EQK3_9TELE|nr:hypothetical protein EYF80_058769 [Liparis tanakae]
MAKSLDITAWGTAHGDMSITYCQGHDTELVPDQLDHLALLQRSGPAADDRLASLAQLQEVAPLLLLQGPVQSPSVQNQDEALRTPLGGLCRVPCCSLTASTTLHLQSELLE